MKNIFLGGVIIFALLVGGFFVFDQYLNQEKSLPETVLQADGLSVVDFGDSSEETISKLSKIFGSPSSDSGLVDSFTVGGCPSDKIRIVEWGKLKVFFGDTLFGKDALFHYDYTARDTTNSLPILYTDAGITLEASKSELLTAHPNTQVYPWLEGYEWMHVVPYNSETKEYLGGSLKDGKVFWITGGIQCGE